MDITKKQEKFVLIVFDDQDVDNIGFVKENIHLIDGVTFSKIDSDEVKVIAFIETLNISYEEFADSFFTKFHFNSVVEIVDQQIEDDGIIPRIASAIYFIKGYPITKAALVVFNDKDTNYKDELTRILLSYNCFNIKIESMVSIYGRKYFLAIFDVKSIDIFGLSKRCEGILNEETIFSVNRNNDFYYNEMLLDSANESSKSLEYKVTHLRKNYYDFSGDDTSLDNRFW